MKKTRCLFVGIVLVMCLGFAGCGQQDKTEGELKELSREIEREEKEAQKKKEEKKESISEEVREDVSEAISEEVREEISEVASEADNSAMAEESENEHETIGDDSVFDFTKMNGMYYGEQEQYYKIYFEMWSKPKDDKVGYCSMDACDGTVYLVEDGKIRVEFYSKKYNPVVFTYYYRGEDLILEVLESDVYEGTFILAEPGYEMQEL